MSDGYEGLVDCEGEPSKKFKLYTTDIKNNPYELVKDTDDPAEIKSYKRRPDKRYVVIIRRKVFSYIDFLNQYPD